MRGRPFAPDQTIWRVNRENALLLGAGRALLLQLAHPLVAAGVAGHSRFSADPFRRLLRTLDTSYALVFGDLATAGAAVRRLDAVHQRVRGVLLETTGPFAAGTPYDAGDPALRLWVHATLIHTSLVVYERFVAPLSPAARAAYYDDACRLARLMGIPEEVHPPTLEAFEAYLSRMLATEIAVGDTARALAGLIFRPPAAVSLRVVGPVIEFVTVGLLPPVVREQYGYRCSHGRERALRAVVGALRRAVPAIPPLIRGTP